MDVEKIAVVGLAGRFPGAQNIQQFWQNLCQGVEARTLFSDAELVNTVDAARLAQPGYVKSGFVLENIDQFDADFFQFDPQQAQITDPQQRLFLECAWEALEVAGIDVKTYDGLVGIYAGASHSNYWDHAYAALDSTAGNLLGPLIGNDKDYLATQTAYRLDLHGPCVSVQSACSTGLVAVHLGCQSLINHECDVALTGGVTVHIPHRVGYPYVEGAIFAKDGRCRAFDAQATGMVFGNGIGVVALKRLSDALADGDQIWAVVRGSAVNNDGARKFGFMTSSRMGQIEVITEAWGVAGVTAQELSYIETHGSGTPIGDVIEFSALATLFAEGASSRKSCAIGSVKTNVGHLETAAGITGFIKTVLALHHRQLPPSLNFSTPNPDINFDQTPLYVNTQLTDWCVNEDQPLRCAGVSSFGIGGANAHVVLEEAPQGDELTNQEQPVYERPFHLLNLTAKNEQALRDLAQRYQTFLAQGAKSAQTGAASPTFSFANLCYTANVGRSHFPHRLSIVAQSMAEAQASLDQFLQTKAEANPLAAIHTGVVPLSPPKVAFLLGDAPHQWLDFGRELYATQPTFQQIIDECDEGLRTYHETSVADFMAAPSRQAEPSLAVLFAVEYAFVRLWQAWGVTPDVLMNVGTGDNSSDYVAACIAQVFTLKEALHLVAVHSKLLQTGRRQVNSAANHITYCTPSIPLLSAGPAESSARLSATRISKAEFWRNHLPERSSTGDIQAGKTLLQARGIACFVERCSSWQALVDQVSQLYVAGVPIQWAAFERAYLRQKIALPTYPFQRKRYWVDSIKKPATQNHQSQDSNGEKPASSQAGSNEAGMNGNSPTQERSTIRQQLQNSPAIEWRAQLTAYLQEMAGQLIHGVTDASKIASNPPARTAIPLQVGFADLGMTSLSAVALRDRLQADLGQKFPATLVLDYPNVNALVGYLSQHLSLHRQEAAISSGKLTQPPDPAPPAWLEETILAPEKALDELSVDELAEKLATKLGMRI